MGYRQGMASKGAAKDLGPWIPACAGMAIETQLIEK
jgi:hypothetical protein